MTKGVINPNRFGDKHRPIVEMLRQSAQRLQNQVEENPPQLETGKRRFLEAVREPEDQRTNQKAA